MSDSSKFHQAMVRIYTRAKEEAGYNATRYLTMVAELGGLETARRLLHSSTVSDGYTALWERGRLDLTVEALILEAEWQSCFNAEERAIAQRRLAEYGYTAPVAEPSRPFASVEVSPTVVTRSGSASASRADEAPVAEPSRPFASVEMFSTVVSRSGSESAPTADDFIQFVAQLEGQKVTTLAGRATFRANVVPSGIEVIPDSTGRSRLIARARIDQVLEEFAKSRSMQTTHYQDITFDSSYLLTLLQRLLESRPKVQ